MMRLRYVHWQEEEHYLGYFEDFPDYRTQGRTPQQLLENLRDLYRDIGCTLTRHGGKHDW
jgi:predicted RNase H-like HicB family nuclease